MRRLGCLSFMLCALMLGFTTVAHGKVRVAVMDFENKTPHGGWRVGRGASDMLATELVKIGKFAVIERDKLASLMKEQELGLSGAVDPSTAAEIGKILGVEYIVTGAVTEYGQSTGGGGGGGVFVGKKGYHATVDVRIVNVQTAEIVFADSGSDSASSVSVRVFGIGGGERFNEKKATEVMRGAIKKLAAKVSAAKLDTPGGGSAVRVSEGDTVVADVEDGIVTLNKGSEAGYKTGQTLTVSRQRKVIKDPVTGKVLKVKYKKVGKIKLTEVEGSYAEGEIITDSGIEVGDVVRP
ncbi:MAG TPA: penicillin-binding protein activator LpoB [Gammaproteobacteria bacterium]|nr:penicillin-binding protein activator LpoB [Gammaproteobacteria bacterium]